MANTTLQKITVTTIATALIGVANAPMFANTNHTKLVTQKFNGTLALNNSSNYSGPSKISYSGFVTYSKPSNGSRCPEGICVPIKVENWSFKLGAKELNSPGISSFEGRLMFNSKSSSNPYSWNLHWLNDPTGDTGNYTINWQQGKGIDLNNVYFRGSYLYRDRSPKISYSSVSRSVSNTTIKSSEAMGLLAGL
jgi:hypothetical protein